MRRQATLSIASGLLCGLDILMAPVIVLMAAFAGDAPNPSPTMLNLITALIVVGAGSAVCGMIALVAGLLGAPRRLVFWVAALPPLALIAVIVVLAIGTK